MGPNTLALFVLLTSVVAVFFHYVIDWSFLKELFPIIWYYGGCCLILLYFCYPFLFARWFLFCRIEKPEIKAYAKRKEIEEQLMNFLLKDVSILVEGPSGSGKSTLCEQMAHELSKEYPVLFYTATKTNFESTLLKSISGVLYPLVRWWNTLSNNSDVDQWFHSILVASKYLKEKPIIFIDEINTLVNNGIDKQLDGKGDLLAKLFNLAQSTTNVRFVFITSKQSHIIHRDPNYSLEKVFAPVFVGEIGHTEAVEYLDSLQISSDIHSNIFQICGYLISFLSKCSKLVMQDGKLNLFLLRSWVEMLIRDRIMKSGLDCSQSQFVSFVKDLKSSKSNEVDLTCLKHYFPEESQIESIIRGNTLYISSSNKVSFQSKGIYNFVLKEMKIIDNSLELCLE